VYKFLFLLIIGALIYLWLPYDLIPESVYGFVGLVDDVGVVCAVLMYIAYYTYSIVVRQAQARVAAQ
jgi:uncharacterized membrane protein YkvA (DUF1232 family)